MTRLLPSSLKFLVPVSLLGFAALLTLLNVAYHAPRAERAVEQDERERLYQDLSRLQSSLEYLLLKGEEEAAYREVAILAFNHKYTLAVLTNERGIVTAANRRAWIGRPVTEVLDAEEIERPAGDQQLRIQLSHNGSMLVASTGVQIGLTAAELRGTRVGRLHIKYDLRQPKGDAMRNLADQTLIWAGWVVGMALLLWIAFHFLLTRRTERLVRAAERFAAGDLSARAGVGGRDEIGKLSRAFDAMARQVGETQTRLQEDISRRMQMEEQLRNSEASYRAIFDAAEDAIFVYDIDTAGILDVNERASVAYGYSREQLLRSRVDRASIGERTYTQEDLQRVIRRAATGERLHFEWQRRSKDGSVHWDEVFFKRVTLGEHVRVLSLAREITAKKTAEAALRASEEQYRAIFNASVDGLALRNPSGAMVEINPALAQLYGLSREQWRGGDTKSVRALNLLSVLHQGDAVHTEITDQRPDGTVLHLEVHVVPMQYQGEQHLLAIVRDVSSRKRAEEELRRQREGAHQREKLAALGSLLAGVAHELNNPLSVVVGRAMLLEEKHDPATYEQAATIRVAAERCARIVRTFLAMARQQPPALSSIDINDVVETALDITGYALRTSNVEVVRRLRGNIPRILADADQLHQVLVNLLINAQQALLDSPLPRRITIRTRFDAHARSVELCVADNGPGIAPDIRSRIFEPFFTTKPIGTGTGVGLSVSLGIVETHGGSISVNCPPEGGTEFRVALPMAPIAAAETATTTRDEERSRSLSVLVVDDERDVLKIIRDVLEAAGHTVTSTESGHDALDLLQEQSFDVIVSDMRMADLDGLAFYGAVRELAPAMADRIVFVTGDTMTSNLREFATHCGQPVLEKPFMPKELRRMVAEVAQRQGAADPRPGARRQ